MISGVEEVTGETEPTGFQKGFIWASEFCSKEAINNGICQEGRLD